MQRNACRYTRRTSSWSGFSRSAGRVCLGPSGLGSAGRPAWSGGNALKTVFPTLAFSRSWDLALQSHAAHFSVASFSAFERVRADLKAYRSIVRGAGILRSVINAATGGHAAALVTNLKKAKPTKAH